MATARQGLPAKPDLRPPRPSDKVDALTDNPNRTKESSRKDASASTPIHSDELALNISLRRFVAFGLLAMITLNTVVTLTAIYLVGFGLMRLSDQIIFTLLGQTVAQIAATFLTVIKYLFPTKA